MNNTTAVPATTAARLVAITRVMRRSPAGRPVLLTADVNDPTGRWAIPTTYSLATAAGLTCTLCDQPANGRPTITTLRAIEVGALWTHLDCDQRLIAEMRADTVRICAAYGFRVPDWAVAR
jgi:hypothetical protein